MYLFQLYQLNIIYTNLNIFLDLVNYVMQKRLAGKLEYNK